MPTNSAQELDLNSTAPIEDITADLNVVQQILAGSQMLFVAFGALVLMPLI
ncbi:MAG: uracil permease, partial [Psychromonas sp.]